jgi:hypothetical protein
VRHGAVPEPPAGAERRHRSTLLAYNTVERLLRGDFFHYVTLEDVVEDLAGFPPEWPLAGIGTTNWFRRNGELMVEGTVGEPSFLWADPTGERPAVVIDLLHDEPASGEDRLPFRSPAMDGDETRPQLPFLGIAVCDPAVMVTWTAKAPDGVHELIEERCAESNIGLAGIRVQASFDVVDYQAMCRIPLGGVMAGTGATAELLFAQAGAEPWNAIGIYAANPTVQNVVSVPDHALHLHGYSRETRQGGHINRALPAEEITVEVWPVKDLLIRIHDLDTALLPVRDLS